MSRFARPFKTNNIKILLNIKSPQQLNIYRQITHYNFPPFVPFYSKSEVFPNRLAVVDCYGQYTYSDIFNYSVALAEQITDIKNEKKKQFQERISFCCGNNATYVIGQWACWMSKNVFVPLCKIHPSIQLQYYIENSQSSIIVTTDEFLDKLKPISDKLSIPLLIMKHPVEMNKVEYTKLSPKDCNTLSKQYNRIKNNNAMILYTSGTTGPPKGVVLTHENLHCAINALTDAWEWTHTDVVLHTLPLHHLHGIVNALMCPLYTGSCCVMLPKFNPVEVWNKLLNINKKEPQITMFMAVPTMYAKLIEEYEKQFSLTNSYSYTKNYIKAVCKENIRLMISGSAALPQSIMERWEQITGHILLERYGMTEIGMALSNPLHGRRLPGYVGNPLKCIEIRIVKENPFSKTGYDNLIKSDYKKSEINEKHKNLIGDLQVFGKTVFKEYWNNPVETKKSFTSDGWFKTGDTAQYVDGAYKILGRTSVDIIKSGGYKISALDIERCLLEHPNIKECAVVGLPDITWGEKIAVIIVTNDGKSMTQSELNEWCKEKLASYLIPSIVTCITELPRNIMGKINKKELRINIFQK